jgi:preprotein translocase subunit YajC
VGTAWAQTGAGEGPPAIVQIMPLLLLGFIFYFLLLRPEQRKRREHDQLVSGLKRNDQIILASGIHGRVTVVGDKQLTVEIARGVQVQVERSGVQTVQKAPVVETREKEREKS